MPASPQLRRPPSRPERPLIFIDSSRPVSANTGHSPKAGRTGQVDPLLPYKIGPMNGREGRGSGLRLRAVDEGVRACPREGVDFAGAAVVGSPADQSKSTSAAAGRIARKFHAHRKSASSERASARSGVSNPFEKRVERTLLGLKHLLLDRLDDRQGGGRGSPRNLPGSHFPFQASDNCCDSVAMRAVSSHCQLKSFRAERWRQPAH